MKRRIFKFVLFLLLGAIINVAVAWLLGTLAPTTSGLTQNALPQAELSELWDRYGGGIESRRYLKGWCLISFGLSRTHLGSGYTIDQQGNELGVTDGGTSMYIDIVDCGLPLKTLRHEESSITLPWPIRLATLRERVNWLKQSKVILPGGVINTILYAVIVWVLCATPGVVRRRIRAHRGRCTACGYDLRGTGHKLCPECGANASNPS